jgi:hypothetical protein
MKSAAPAMPIYMPVFPLKAMPPPHPKNLADSCSEDCAESVLDNEKANFCDFIKVNPKAYRKKDEAPAMAAQAF